jgi:hypothetical protein
MAVADKFVVTQLRPIEATKGAVSDAAPATDVDPTTRTLFNVFVLLLTTLIS